MKTKKKFEESRITIKPVEHRVAGSGWATNRICPFASRMSEYKFTLCGTWCPLCQINSISISGGKPRGIKMACGSGISHDVVVIED